MGHKLNYVPQQRRKDRKRRHGTGGGCQHWVRSNGVTSHKQCRCAAGVLDTTFDAVIKLEIPEADLWTVSIFKQTQKEPLRQLVVPTRRGAEVIANGYLAAFLNDAGCLGNTVVMLAVKRARKEARRLGMLEEM